MSRAFPLSAILLLSLIISFNAQGKLKGEYGVGMEYGIIGAQLYLPTSPYQKLETYLSFGIAGLKDNQEDETDLQKAIRVLSGVGINYRASRNSKWTLYGGYMGNECEPVDFQHSICENYYGLSVGYKHRLHFISKKLFVGANYNMNKKENFFSASVSYQFDWGFD